jgi:hypothetical protein
MMEINFNKQIIEEPKLQNIKGLAIIIICTIQIIF